MAFDLKGYIREKQNEQGSGQRAEATPSTPSVGGGGASGGFDLKSYIKRKGIASGQLQREDEDFNAWMGDLESFSTRVSGDYTKRQGAYQPPADFRAYQSKTDQEIADLLARGERALGYYKTWGEDYDKAYGEGKSQSLLAGIDEGLSYLVKTRRALRDEDAYWGQFEDEEGWRKAQPEYWTQEAHQKRLDDMQAELDLKNAVKNPTQAEDKELERKIEQETDDYNAYQKMKEYTKLGAADRELGQFGAGNIDLYNRPQLQNADGSISTVQSITISEGGQEIVIPTIAFGDGGVPYRMSDQQAIAKYHATGEYLGKFETPEEAEAYAQKLHQAQEFYYWSRPNQELTTQGEQEMDYWATFWSSLLDEQAPPVWKDSGWKDPFYAWVNGSADAGAYLKLQDNTYGAAAGALGHVIDDVVGGNQEVEQMSPEEIATYNYIYATQSPGEARAFYEYIKSDLYRRQRAAEEKRWAEWAVEDPWGTSAFSILMSPMKGVSYAMQLGDYLGDGEIDQNAPHNSFSYVPAAIRGQVVQDIEKYWVDRGHEFGGKTASFLYQTGMSMGDFLFTTAVSGGNEGVALAIMGTGAAADATIEAKDRGLSDDQAFALGTIAGIAEVVTEKFSLDALLKGKWEQGAVRYVIKNAFTEGTEEVGSDAINLFADILIAKDQSQWAQAIAAYEADGMSESEAFWRAVQDQALSMGLDFLGGALSGGVLSGGNVAISSAVNNYTNGKKGKTFRANGGDVDALVAEGLKQAPGSEAYQQAQMAQKKLEGGKALSNRDVGRLYQAGLSAVEGELLGAAVLADAQETYVRQGSVGQDVVDAVLSNPAAVAQIAKETGISLDESMGKGRVKTAVNEALGMMARGETIRNSDEARVRELERGIAELDAQQVERGAADLGTQGQATVRAMYMENQNAEAYIQGMRELYQAGLAGVELDTVDSQAVQSLNDYQRRAAYTAGQVDRFSNSQTLGKVEGGENLPFYFGSEEGAVDHEQAGGVRVREGGQWADGAGAQEAAGGVAEGAGGHLAGGDRAGPADAGAGALQVGRAVSTYALGIADGVKTDSVRIVTGGETESIRAAKAEAAQRGLEVVAFAGGNLHVQVPDGKGNIITVEARGYISGNKVYVRGDHAELSAYQLWRHEAYHDMAAAGEVDPSATKEAVRELLGDELTARLEEAYSRALNGLEGVELWEEIAADQYGGINFFAGTSLAREMEALGVLVGTQTEAQMAKSQTAEATARRTGPPQTQKTAAQREPGGGKMSAERSDEGIYDYSKSFEEQLEDYEAGKIPKNDTLLVCGTPKVFRRIGLLSLPMTMNQTHIGYALNGTKDMDHFLRKDGLLQLPAALEHPIAIISSKTKTGTSLVAILEVRQNGKQVIVPVVVDGFGAQNGLRIDSNSLTSAYGKNYSISRVLYDALENEASGVPFSTYYVDATKATELFRGARVPMPKMPATRNGGFIHSIAEQGSPVKRRLGDVTQTQQFKRWFNGSKVVDAEGKPLVVYHGTDAEFTVFRSEDGAYWFGDQDYAAEMARERGGSRVVPAYLDMKNPYYASLEPGKFMDPAFEAPIIQAAKEGGYDGVVLKADVDSDLAENSFYVVFEPTQIKSATANIGTFDGTNPDIRFSQEPGGYVQELRELERENKRLRKRVDELMGEFRLSGGPTVDRGAVRTEAGKLIKSLGVKGMSIDSVAQRLQDIYDLISTGRKGGDELSYGAVREMAEDLARDVLGRAVEKDDSAYREYSELRAYFKDTQLILSEADSRDIPDYGEWRKALGRRVKLRRAKTGEMSNVDAVFREAAGMWPELFDEKTTSAASDQVRQIAEALDWAYQVTEVNPYSSYMEEAVQWTANDIIKAYGDLPMGRGTVADQWQAKVRKAQAEGREAVRQQRLVDDMYYGRKRAETLRWARERVDRVVAYEKARTQAKIAEMKAWYAGRDAQAREYKQNSEARNRLLKLTQRLERMKTTTANKALIQELIGELDTAARSLTGTKRLDLEQLRRDYQDYQNPDSERYDPDFIPDQRVMKDLDRLSRKHINDLDQKDVEDLTKALLNLEHEIRTSKRLLQEEENRTIYQLGQKVIDEMEAVQGSKATGIGAALNQYVTSEVLSPLRMVRRMTGWRDGSPLLKATEGLNQGQRTMLDYQMRAEKPFLHFAKDKAFAEAFSGPKAREVKIGGWTKDGLVEVTVTPAMRASIYLHSLNPQNARHMAQGGVTVPDMKLYKKGKLAEAYARGTTVKIKPSDTQRLFRAMGETERAFVREAQRYFREVSQPELSRVSETLRGYAPTMLENYFPIVTNKNFMKQEITFDADGTATILKPGYLEERINASGPMMLQDVDSVVDHAIQQHGLFVGLAVPVRNFNKLWNVSTVGVTEGGEYYSYAGSVKEAVDSAWGTTGKRYIEKMVKDVQGRQHAHDQWGSWMDRLRGNYAGAVLTLNASVAIKQAASYPTAAAVLGWKPLVKAMGAVGKVDLDLIAKYTPLQWYRSKGFASKELGDMARNNKVMPKWLNWIQGMDLATTRKLWKAAEFYVRDHNKALRIGSDAYYRVVAEVYDRVIEETQPNYTAMQRPQLLRSESDLMKNLAMFKTQPMQNLNILYDAAGDFLAKRRQFKAGEIDLETYRQAGRNLGNAVTSQWVQAAVFAGMTLAWAVIRGRMDKYKDEEKDEVTAEALMKALGVDMGMNLVSGIPLLPELGEYFVKKVTGETAYAPDVTSVSMVIDVLDAVSKVTKMVVKDFSGEPEDLEGHARTVWDAAEVVSKGLGLPVENVTNLFNAGYRQTVIFALGKYRGEYEALRLAGGRDRDYYDNLYKAMVNDRAAYLDIYEDMVRHGWDEAKIKKALEDRMKKAQGAKSVDEMERRWVSPEDEEDFDRALGQLEGSKLWRQASLEQRGEAEDIVYTLLTSESKSTQATLDKLEVAGLDEGTYALYKLAVEMYDEPNDNGNLGTITNAEREAAIRAMEGLTDRERAALWIVGGGKESSNPWG